MTSELSRTPSVDGDGDEVLTTDSLFGHHGLVAPSLNKKEEKEKTKYEEFLEREAHTPTLSSSNLEKLSTLIDLLCSQSLFTPHQHHILRSMLPSRIASQSLHEASQLYATDETRESLKMAWETAMLQHLEQRWEHLFQDCSTADGKKISKAERANLGISKASLVYGEVSFESLGRVLWGPHVVLPTQGKFVDLGSGTGRAVFAATLLHPFSHLQGIEILHGLYQASEEIAKRWRTEKSKQHINNGTSPTHPPEISFYKGSFLEIDWSDADIVFANSTCFDEPLMNDIAVEGQKLKVGAYVITLTKRLSSPYFKLINSTQYTMSWLVVMNMHVWWVMPLFIFIYVLILIHPFYFNIMHPFLPLQHPMQRPHPHPS